MAADIVVYAGTIGQGVWRSEDGGETFSRFCNGMFIEAQVRALVAHPQNSNILYAGTDAGLYRTEDRGAHWQRLPVPFDPGNGWPAGVLIWSLLIHPHEPQTLFAGTCPPAIYRSQDAGQSWQKLAVDIEPECPPLVYSRLTWLMSDPDNAHTIWAGVEVGGVWRSDDNGDSWQQLTNGLSSLDIHALAIVPGSPRRLLATTNNDLNISEDEGQTWQPQKVSEQFPWRYCRGLAAKADDPHTIFLGNGNGPPGTAGALQISHNGGQSWLNANLSPAPNSTVWTFATNPADPNLIFCAAINGYLYRSPDGGQSWQKCHHEFGEVRTIVWLPA